MRMQSTHSGDNQQNLWLAALTIYLDVAKRIKWNEQIFSDDAIAMMKEELERIQTMESNRVASTQNFWEDTDLESPT